MRFAGGYLQNCEAGVTWDPAPPEPANETPSALRLDASRLVSGKQSRALVHLHVTHVVVRSCSYFLYILSIT